MQDSPRPALSIVIPCFGEGEHLASSLAAIAEAAAGTGETFELVVIDDGSRDGTWDVLQRVSAERSELHAVRLSRRFGKELALCCGLERARGEAALVMDADLQHPPALIPELVHAWRAEGYEVVEAVKQVDPAAREQVTLGSRLFHFLLTRLSGFDLEGASDFKLIDRKVLEAWAGMPERSVFFRGMSAWLGFRRKQVPFHVAPRAGGDTGWSTLGLVRLALTAVTAFSTLPLHLITLMGLIFMGFAVVLGVNSLVQKFTGVALTGFTTVIVLQLVIGSMLMIGLGILGAYVARIYDEVKHRPRYVVAEELSSTETPTAS